MGGKTSEKITCLKKSEVDALARFKLGCDTAKLDLGTMERAYIECKGRCESESWYHSTEALVIFGILAVGIGGLVGSQIGRK